jgi:hypothetical protein
MRQHVEWKLQHFGLSESKVRYCSSVLLELVMGKLGALK